MLKSSYHEIKKGGSRMLDELSAVLGLCFVSFISWSLRNSLHEMKIGITGILDELS